MDELLPKFKRLTKAGNTPLQIMTKLGIDTEVYLRLCRIAGNDSRCSNLTAKDYVTAIKSNKYADKEELAHSLNVTEPTLINFEEKTGILQLCCRCWHINGKSTQDINKELFTRTTKSAEYTEGTPVLSSVIQDIQTIIDTYDSMARYDNAYIHKASQLKRIKKKLEDLTPKI